MDHQEYLKRRDELLAIRMDSFSSFDKAILSLATGSLALSMAFLEKIGEPFNRATFTLIVLTWVSFFVVILFNLASYHFARVNMDKKITELDNRYQQGLESEKVDASPEAVFWQKRATSISNSGAFVAFCVGVLFFVIYIVNIQIKNYQEIRYAAGKDRAMPEGKQTLNEGKTESPKAVPKTTPKTASPGDDVTTHGATEAPQAVLRPTKPSGTSSGGAKESK